MCQTFFFNHNMPKFSKKPVLTMMLDLRPTKSCCAVGGGGTVTAKCKPVRHNRKCICFRALELFRREAQNL